MRGLLLFSTASLLLGNSCQLSIKNDQKVTVPVVQTNSRAQILNGIIVHESGGLVISRAFLASESGELLNARNLVSVGETVYLVLVVAQGWMAQNGFVSLGALQTITTDKGEPVLTSPDLFAGKAQTEEAKAGQVRLKTVITNSRSDTRTFVVRYRVWDKNGSGEVSGSFQLHMNTGGAK
jgi:hypothetical protein